MQDPDYQLIFQYALFGKDTNLNTSKANLVCEHLEKHVDRFMHQNDPYTSVFLIRMNRYFSHFEDFKNITFDGMEFLKSLLNRPGLKPEEKSLIYVEIAAHLSEKKETHP